MSLLYLPTWLSHAVQVYHIICHGILSHGHVYVSVVMVYAISELAAHGHGRTVCAQVMVELCFGSIMSLVLVAGGPYSTKCGVFTSEGGFLGLGKRYTSIFEKIYLEGLLNS